jgi:hypothetical protein
MILATAQAQLVRQLIRLASSRPELSRRNDRGPCVAAKSSAGPSLLGWSAQVSRWPNHSEPGMQGSRNSERHLQVSSCPGWLVDPHPHGLAEAVASFEARPPSVARSCIMS